MSEYGLSEAEFLREAERRLGWKPKPAVQNPLETASATDLIDCLPDLLRAFSSKRNARSEHPLVTPLLRDGVDLLRLREMAMQRGMSHSDFGTSLADGLSVLSISRFEVARADIAKVARNYELQNYMGHDLPVLSMVAPPEMIDDSEMETPAWAISEAPSKGKLRSFGARISFSKSVWSALGAQLTLAVADYVQSFAQVEMRLLAELLENSNTIPESLNSSYSGLIAAVENMRQQLNAAGQKANLSIASIICPPRMELPLMEEKVKLGWPGLNIVPNVYLASDRTYYAVCNPAISAPVVRLILRGGGVPRIMSSSREGFETQSFAFEHSVNYALTNQPGILKCTSEVV